MHIKAVKPEDSYYQFHRLYQLYMPATDPALKSFLTKGHLMASRGNQSRTLRRQSRGACRL